MIPDSDGLAPQWSPALAPRAFGEMPPMPPRANVPFPKLPQQSPYINPSSSAPESTPPRGGERGFGRGDVVECESCGYVFVIAGRHGACRRCKKGSLVKWRGT